MVETSRASWIAGEQRQLGKYELFHRLATGGMAEIYLARAAAIEGFEKLVVVKRILPQHAENEAFIRMFLAEARLAATLHHPNIVQVYDIGEQDGTYFFAMEHVHGLDLRRLLLAAIDAGRWPPLQHILHIVRGVCAGLHYAHEKKDGSGTPLGIVHRDISPSNVLVTFDGGVKVVDFGIAKASNVSTSSGTLKGKLAYMSPEQCRSETLDRRSDVYSIGTLLWELTTGRRLFKAQTELELMKRVAQGDVLPPSAVRPDIPRALEEIILKALSVDVEQRYGSARALQLDLEDFAHDAHLPLSDARLQPYVRELCADQISKLDELLAAYHRTTPPSVTERRVEPEPAEAPPHDGGAAQTADMGELATATYRSSQVPGGMAASGGGARRTSWLAVSVVGMAVAAG
ncbi:MAG: serine/threonine protein kinase, partial [Deltaproteobacteria bacterium]|nr:serine/threonine protein kinase [Deltaproteobacteria bacterium]